jgi:hypothetical protein
VSFDLDTIINEELEYVRAEFAAQEDCATRVLVNLEMAPKFRGANSIIQEYKGENDHNGTVEFVLAGPAETGKTWAALWLLDRLCRENAREELVLARKIQSTIWGTVLVTWKRIQALREKMGQEQAAPYGGEKPEFYDYPNGSRLWVGGMDNPQKILSGERGAIYFNQAEEFELKDWETCLSRATGRGSKMNPPLLFGDANPGPEDHWILKRPQIKLFKSRHVDNPSLYDDAGELTEQGTRTMATLKSLTGIRYQRLYLGEWVGAEGLFFEEWDDDLHTCEPFKIPADWPIWGAFDHGFAHNTAFGLFTQHQDVIYMIAEHVRNKWLAPPHCKAIRRQVEIAGVPFARLRQIAAGHDVFQRRADSEGKTIEEQYRDAVDPDTGERIGIRGFEKATLDRPAGAKELLELLGNREAGIKPRLKVFRQRCPRTIATMKRMVTDPKDAEDVLKADTDANGAGGDDCFIAGTLIETSNGSIPIEQISVGDLVLTRAGYRKIRAVWDSRKLSTVLRATFSNGRHLTGTPNHPFFVQGYGWRCMDALRYGDIMSPLWGNQHRSRRPSSSTAYPFEDTQNLSTQIIESIIRQARSILSRAWAISMWKSGNRFTDQFLLDTISTIKTRIHSITQLTTLNALIPSLISKSTGRPEKCAPQSRFEIAESGPHFLRAQQIGIGQMRAGLGMFRWQKLSGRKKNLLVTLASNAGILSNLLKRARFDFVRTSAKLNGGEIQGLTIFRNLASDAERSLIQTNTTSCDFAQENAAALRLVDLVEVGKADTFALHVGEQHEYYANGVLVKNCYDMIRYGVMAKRKGANFRVSTHQT